MFSACESDIGTPRYVAIAQRIPRLLKIYPQFIFLVTLTDVSKYKDLALNHDAIVTKPIKAQSLYNATKNSQTSDTGGSAKSAQKKLTMDNTYSKVGPICHYEMDNVLIRMHLTPALPSEGLLYRR